MLWGRESRWVMFCKTSGGLRKELWPWATKGTKCSEKPGKTIEIDFCTVSDKVYYVN